MQGLHGIIEEFTLVDHEVPATVRVAMGPRCSAVHMRRTKREYRCALRVQDSARDACRSAPLSPTRSTLGLVTRSVSMAFSPKLSALQRDTSLPSLLMSPAPLSSVRGDDTPPARRFSRMVEDIDASVRARGFQKAGSRGWVRASVDAALSPPAKLHHKTAVEKGGAGSKVASTVFAEQSAADKTPKHMPAAQRVEAAVNQYRQVSSIGAVAGMSPNFACCGRCDLRECGRAWCACVG